MVSVRKWFGWSIEIPVVHHIDGLIVFPLYLVTGNITIYTRWLKTNGTNLQNDIDTRKGTWEVKPMVKRFIKIIYPDEEKIVNSNIYLPLKIFMSQL